MVAGTSGGGFGGNSTNVDVAQALGHTESRIQWVLARLRRKTAGMPGATMFRNSQTCTSAGGRATRMSIPLQGPDFASLEVWGPKILQGFWALPEMAELGSDQQTSGLSSNVVIDRDTASRLGLTAQAVDAALYDAFGERQVLVMYKSMTGITSSLRCSGDDGRTRVS